MRPGKRDAKNGKFILSINRETKMKVLILGITGMLGHVVWRNLKKDLEVYGTVRGEKKDLIEKYPLFEDRNENIIDRIDALSEDTIDKAIEAANPDVVINCIGIVKQLKEAKDPVLSIPINSLFPHILAKKCEGRNIRSIHISTDCVFSGKKGLYRETDICDAEDLYGRTKYLGEVNGSHCLTIRTSLVGRELKGKRSLLEWFLAQKGQIRGYKRAIFSGLTTYTFVGILKEIIEKYPKLSGIYHIASNPINKYELLMRLKNIYQKDIDIVPDETIIVDRSLDSSKFKRDTSIRILDWDEMLEDLKKERSI